MKHMSFFPRAPPGEKLGIFAKMSKSMHNIKIRAISLFYEMGAKFPKKIFGQNVLIFTLGGQFVCSSSFCIVTSVNRGQPIKKQVENV